MYVGSDKLKQHLRKLGLIRHVFQGQNYKVRLVEVKARAHVIALDVSRQSEELSHEYQLQTAVKNAGNRAKPSILQDALALRTIKT